jgi:hypothetical protein
MSYLGLPYETGGMGPESFNCWGFVRYYLQREHNISIPVIPGDGALTVARLLQDHPEKQNWLEVATPENGDIVMLSYNRRPHHVGVWENGVLHCVKGMGVVFHTRQRLALERWNITGIYRHAGCAGQKHC